MHSVFPTQAATEQRFANAFTHTVRIKPYNTDVDDTSKFVLFVCLFGTYVTNLKEKMCPKSMLTLSGVDMTLF